MLSNSIALVAIAAMFGIEAYKVSERLPRIVLTGIAVSFALGALAIQPLADASPSIGAFVTDIFVQPVSWFLLFMGLFFVLRPFWQSRKVANLSGDELARQLQDLLETVRPALESQATLNESFEKRLRAVANDVSKLPSRERVVADIGNFVGPQFKETGECIDTLEKRANQNEAIIQTTIAMVREVQGHLIEEARELRSSASNAVKEQNDFQTRMETWIGQLREGVEARFEWIDQGMAAILDRERLLDLAQSIETIAQELSGPTRGEAMNDYADWLVRMSAWRCDVEQWARLGETYRTGVIERVHNTPENDYRGKWKAADSLFPDSVAVHDFKTFRIIYKNFREEQEQVENCVRMAAFARPSLKGRQPIPRDENQMPIQPVTLL